MQTRSFGAGGSIPCSTARSMISSTSMPIRRVRSVIGTAVLRESAGRRAVREAGALDVEAFRFLDCEAVDNRLQLRSSADDRISLRSVL